ncbi:MAG: hypothetical protein WC430_02655 [Patescibacteria group bacterium]
MDEKKDRCSLITLCSKKGEISEGIIESETGEEGWAIISLPVCGQPRAAIRSFIRGDDAAYIRCKGIKTLAIKVDGVIFEDKLNGSFVNISQGLILEKARHVVNLLMMKLIPLNKNDKENNIYKKLTLPNNFEQEAQNLAFLLLFYINSPIHIGYPVAIVRWKKMP